MLSKLLSIEHTKDEFLVGSLVAQVNLLGVVLNLPSAVQRIKDDLEKQEVQLQKQKDQDFDPLAVLDAKEVSHG